MITFTWALKPWLGLTRYLKLNETDLKCNKKGEVSMSVNISCCLWVWGSFICWCFVHCISVLNTFQNRSAWRLYLFSWPIHESCLAVSARIQLINITGLSYVDILFRCADPTSTGVHFTLQLLWDQDKIKNGIHILRNMRKITSIL